MEKLNSFTYMADKDCIFVDKETEEINHGNLIQIGLIEKDGEILNIFGVKKSSTILNSKQNNILITLREKQ